MREVSIIGAGVTKFGELWDKSLRELGLMAGLEAIQSSVDAAFVTSCDVPLLEPAFVGRMFALLGEHD
ncbi:MAG: thiolase domain-containing protein, partial [Candidatus Poseidoniia archaeon]